MPQGLSAGFSSDIREALLEAVNRFGRDGEGEEGIVVYPTSNPVIGATLSLPGKMSAVNTRSSRRR
jgi:hypothetical protein